MLIAELPGDGGVCIRSVLSGTDKALVDVEVALLPNESFGGMPFEKWHALAVGGWPSPTRCISRTGRGSSRG